MANNANIAITGDISLDQARQIANQLTQSLTKGNAAPALPDAKPLTAEQRIHIPFNSTQTTVIIGQLGNKRDNSPTALQQQTNFALGNEVVGGADFRCFDSFGFAFGLSHPDSHHQKTGWESLWGCRNVAWFVGWDFVCTFWILVCFGDAVFGCANR